VRMEAAVGARSEFIKRAPVSWALRQRHEEIIIHTGQHYDYRMSALFFDELTVPAPDYNLEVGSASHGAQTGRMLEAIEQILMKERPDWVIVYGDTNSTLAGALAAAKLHIPIAHVEAGLRSFNRTIPEEVNRVVAGHPRTRACLERYDITWRKHIQLIEPVSYIDMLALERGAYRIFTDSGGVQKEAFLLGVPCVTRREETEWPETVEAGWNVLVGSSCQAIIEAAGRAMPNTAQQNAFGHCN